MVVEFERRIDRGEILTALVDQVTADVNADIVPWPRPLLEQLPRLTAAAASEVEHR